MTARGFRVEVVFCGECGDSAEALPQGEHSTVKGLPVGWQVVEVRPYKEARDESPTSPWPPRFLYYCSAAHLPVALLPQELE